MASSARGSPTMPVISKLYCSPSQAVLVVRRRPHVVNGGGFVVTDCSQKVVFRVDGCGVLGSKGELLLRDADGDPLLLIRKKGGIVEALSIKNRWKGYRFGYDGSEELAFTLKQPAGSCLGWSNNGIKISAKPTPATSNNSLEFEIKGYFPARACTLVDSKGNILAQVGVKEEVDKLMTTKDVYHVMVNPGIDQAFVFGVVAVLDYIHGESTRC